jgi:hypothetical protein
MRPNYGGDRRAENVVIGAEAKHPDESGALAAKDAGEEFLVLNGRVSLVNSPSPVNAPSKP